MSATNERGSTFPNYSSYDSMNREKSISRWFEIAGCVTSFLTRTTVKSYEDKTTTEETGPEQQKGPQNDRKPAHSNSDDKSSRQQHSLRSSFFNRKNVQDDLEGSKGVKSCAQKNICCQKKCFGTYLDLIY